MVTIVIIMIFSFMKDFLNVHNASWRSDLFVMNKKSDCFPLNLIFCKLLDTDRPCPSQIFQASTTQTILSSVTESLRLCSTEERSEMKEEVLGSVPNDLPGTWPRHLSHRSCVLGSVSHPARPPSCLSWMRRCLLWGTTPGAMHTPCQYAELGARRSASREWTYLNCLLDWYTNHFDKLYQ